MAKFAFDNTEKTKAESAKNSRKIEFFEQNCPALPPVSLNKPPIQVGQIAFSVDGRSGVAIDFETVNDTFVRPNEWSSEKWTEEERNTFFALHEKWSRISRENEAAANSAYGVRLALAKEFVGAR